MLNSSQLKEKKTHHLYSISKNKSKAPGCALLLLYTSHKVMYHESFD